LIALNFEAALRVSYTANILALKKRLFTSEIQEAKYEAMNARIKEKDLELSSCNEALSSLQKENSKLIMEHEQNRRATESLLQDLQEENAALRLNLNDAAVLGIEKDSLIKDLETDLNHTSSQNEALDRQLKHTSQQIEKTKHLERKLAKISMMLRNEYFYID
jgi:chromosome segregation ATPase